MRGKKNCKRPCYCQQDYWKKQKRCVPANTLNTTQEGMKRIRSESYLTRCVTFLLREIDQILVGHFYTRYLKRSCVRKPSHCPFFVDLHWIEYQDLVWFLCVRASWGHTLPNTRGELLTADYIPSSVCVCVYFAPDSTNSRERENIKIRNNKKNGCDRLYDEWRGDWVV